MLIFAAIAPHGGDLIPQLTDQPAVMAKTRDALRELGHRFAAAAPDTVVIATPHGIVAEGAVTVGGTELAAGILDGPNGGRVKAVFPCDRELATAIEEAGAAHRLPFLRLVGEEKGAAAVLPLDWGALVPLWFTAHPMTPRPRVVVLAPDRLLPREILVRTGVAIARAAAASGKRIALLASCDLGHAHSASGPEGFHPAAAEHDAAFCQAVAEDDLGRLLDWSEDLLEAAKVDAYWQALILAGALGHTPLRGELLSYEAPTYFGMAVAAYQ